MFRRIWRSIRDFRPRRALRFLKQRITRGWTDRDTWNLDLTMAQYICPRLKRFKELNDGFPNGYTWEGWNEALDKMIDAFEILSDEHGSFTFNQEDAKVVEEGLRLFAERYCDLWW